jgi:hypothetical protein
MRPLISMRNCAQGLCGGFEIEELSAICSLDNGDNNVTVASFHIKRLSSCLARSCNQHVDAMMVAAKDVMVASQVRAKMLKLGCIGSRVECVMSKAGMVASFGLMTAMPMITSRPNEDFNSK